MKNLYFSLGAFFCFITLQAQTNPTLEVGLETLTMNKGTIDVELLTKIIMEKQKELKGEAMKRFMLKLFPEENFTTKFYIQNCLHILLNEKNPKVIEKEILELTTNYALALGVTYALIKSNDESVWELNSAYENYKGITVKPVQFNNPINNIDKENLITQVRGKRFFGLYFQQNLIKKQYNLYKQQEVLEKLKSENNTADFNKARKDTRKIQHKENMIRRKEMRIFEIKQRREISQNDDGFNLFMNISRDVYNQTNCKKDKRYFKKFKFSIENDSFIKLNIKGMFRENTSHTLTSKSLSFPKNENMSELNIFCTKKNIDLTIPFENYKEYKNCEFFLNGILKENSNKTEILNQLKELEPKLHVPFNRILDVVSLSLSDMESLRKKGLFKTKIDYRTGDYYLKLGLEVKGLQYQKDLQIFKDSVCKRISPYIENYEVIKELIAKNEKLRGKGKEEIIETLKNETIELIDKAIEIDEIFNKKNKPLESISKEILEIKELNNKLTSLNKIKKIKHSLTTQSEENTDYKSLDNQIKYLKQINELIDSTKNPDLSNLKLKDTVSLKYFTITRDETTNPSDSERPIKEDTISNPEKIMEFNMCITLIKQKSFEDIEQGIYKQRKQKLDNIVNNNGFYKIFLKSVMESTLTENFKENFFTIDTATVSKRAKILSELYAKLDNIVKSEKVNLGDIIYIESNIIKTLVELKARESNEHNDSIYQKLLNNSQIIIPLLKIKALNDVEGIGLYNQQLLTLFEFISNLDKLDKAETFTSIVDMLRTGSDSVEDNLKEGEFKDGYLVFINAIKKYTIVNTNENYLEVDVASFLNDLQTYYGRNENSRFSLYLSIGLNENIFLSNGFTFPGTDETIENIGFASEKLGLRYRLHSFRKYGDYKNIVKNDIYINDRAPFINDLYAIIYGSGLLYSLANTATNENFDFAHLGMGVGVRFYNALDVNFIIGFPFVKDNNFGDDAFIGIGFDIPLGEYLERLGE